LGQVSAELRFGREARLHIANLTIDRGVELIVGDFDLELLGFLEQQLLVDHRVERLQLVRAERCRVHGRFYAALRILENALLEIETRDRLIANNGDNPIERRVLSGRRLLANGRSCAKRQSEREKMQMSSHSLCIPVIDPRVSFPSAARN